MMFKNGNAIKNEKDRESSVEKIFEKDEMTLMKVEKSCPPEVLLQKEGIFFLKDVVEVLELDSAKVIKRAREIEAQGENAWAVMGIRKVWNHWAIRMTIFAPYYREHLKSPIRSVKSDWDSNVLLKQKGLFLLSDVCHLIPFTTYQIRYQAKQNPNAVEEYGIWKDEELNRFVVNMEVFAQWIIKLWKGNYSS